MKKTILLCLVLFLLMFVSVSAVAETVAIPVVSLDGECLNDYQNWNNKENYYSATFTFTDGDNTFTKDIEIKPQGTSSMAYPKKNFTVKFAESVEFAENWGAQKKFVLKADYIDPTRSCNVVSAKLAAEMNKEYNVLADTPNYGVTDGFPVWVKINGEDAGIFNLTIPKDTWMLGMDSDNPNHLVLACEGWTPACTMQSSDIDFELDWTFEVGEPTEESKAAFKRVVEFVATADDQTFVEQFDQYLDLDACLNYICFINTAYGHDNVTKNLLMATYDGKIWYPIIYDLDSLWGIGWDGTELAEPEGLWMEDLWSDRNNLFRRIKNLFNDQVRERYSALRQGILSKEHIIEAFENYAAQIPQEYYEIDSKLWNADGSRIRTVELMSQVMDQYLPNVDAAIEDSSDEFSDAAVAGPAIHYVWEKNGVQQSAENIDALPVSMTLSYTLDGNAVTAEELTGKSGHLEAVLRVERKVDAERVYGVTALMEVKEAQCQNLMVTGGSCTVAEQKYVCMGSAWMGGTHNVYEMKLSLDVTEFDPAVYTVVVNPVHFDGGNDNDTLNALLATAGELTSIIDEGIELHTLRGNINKLLKNMQYMLDETENSVQEMLPAAEEAASAVEAAAEQTVVPQNAASVMQNLLADAELAADAMLTEMGYEVAAEATSADRVQMLSEIAAAAERTEEEKAQAAEKLALIEKYLIVAGELEKTQQNMSKISSSLNEVTANLPELVDTDTHVNNQLYALVYKISMLYQNLSDYYYANSGYSGGIDLEAVADWYDVIVFSNDEGVAVP